MNEGRKRRLEAARLVEISYYRALFLNSRLPANAILELYSKLLTGGHRGLYRDYYRAVKGMRGGQSTAHMEHQGVAESLVLSGWRRPLPRGLGLRKYVGNDSNWAYDIVYAYYKYICRGCEVSSTPRP